MKRNISLDILKLAMAFMVVGLHAGFLSEYSSFGEYLTVNGLFRIAVPVFFIISGFYFYTVSCKDMYFKWFKRIFILYVFWMLFYSYFWVYIPQLTLHGLSRLVISLLFGYHHLWYVSGLFGAAFILFLLRNFSSFVLFSSVLITFLCGAIIQYSGNYHLFANHILDKYCSIGLFHRNMLFFSYPFFCLGYLIHKHSIQEKISLNTAGLLTIIGLVFLLMESYLNYFQEGRDGGFDIYFSLLLLCPFIFIFFIKIKIFTDNKNISLYSSSIYFIHSLILSILSGSTAFGGTLLTILTLVISIFASYFIIKINKKVKFVL